MKVKFIKTLNFIYFYIFCILFLLFTGIGLLRDKNLGPANAGVNSLSANISINCLDADGNYAPFTNITRGVPLTNYGGHDYWNVERSNQLSNNLNGKFLNSGAGSFYVYATIRNAVNFQSRTASVNWDSTSNTNSQSGSFGVIAEAGEARATFLYDERYFDVSSWSFSSIGKNNNNYATTLKNGMTLPIWASGINGVTVNFTMTFIPKMTSVTFYKQLGDNAPEQIGQNNYRFTKKLTSSHVPAANAINGYTFNGWYDKSGNFLTKSQNLLVYDLAATFTAKYTPNKYTVTLNKNNGAGGTDSITATYDSAMPSISLPSRFGYTFQGYYDTSAQTGGTQYYTLTGASARAWNKTSNSTLYARWSANSHNILLKAEGGLLSNGKDSKQISRTFGSEYGNDLNEVPTRQGYTFLGWYTDTGNKVVATDTFELDNDQTLYAHWQAKSYQATFDDQGGKTNFVDMSNVKSGTITNSGIYIRYKHKYINSERYSNSKYSIFICNHK